LASQLESRQLRLVWLTLEHGIRLIRIREHRSIPNHSHCRLDRQSFTLPTRGEAGHHVPQSDATALASTSLGQCRSQPGVVSLAAVCSDQIEFDALGRPLADAALLATPGWAAAFTTADCLPIVLTAEVATPATGPLVVAVHAGWRSLAAGIIEVAVAALRAEPGYAHARLCCWVGPGIAATDYEISEEVRTLLLRRLEQASVSDPEAFFVPNRPGHWLADLPSSAAAILAAAGLKASDISICPLSTFSSPDLHSARRDGAASGRMATVAALLPEGY